MESDGVKVESVERRGSACCYVRRRRERLTGACSGGSTGARHFAILAVSARNVQAEDVPS